MAVLYRGIIYPCVKHPGERIGKDCNVILSRFVRSTIHSRIWVHSASVWPMVLERTFGEDPRLRVLGLISTLRGEPVTVVITDQYFSLDSHTITRMKERKNTGPVHN